MCDHSVVLFEDQLASVVMFWIDSFIRFSKRPYTIAKAMYNCLRYLTSCNFLALYLALDFLHKFVFNVFVLVIKMTIRLV